MFDVVSGPRYWCAVAGVFMEQAAAPICPSIPDPSVYMSSRVGLLKLDSATSLWCSSAMSLVAGMNMRYGLSHQGGTMNGWIISYGVELPMLAY
jgi:hypothetical protein